MKEIAEFVELVDLLYGHYLDCVIGFRRIRDHIVDAQVEIRKSLPHTDLDACDFIIGYGDDPGQAAHVRQHKTTQGEFKLRNSPGGENYVRASQNLIVLLFAYWDSGYREKIARALGIKASDLKVPVMGDLRRLRNDLAHCSGRLQKENAAKLERLHAFKAGNLISMDEAEVFALVGEVKASMSEISASYGK